MKLKSILKVARTDTTWILLSWWQNGTTSIWKLDIFSPSLQQVYSRAKYYSYQEGLRYFKIQKKHFGATTLEERNQLRNKLKKTVLD